MTDMKKIPLLWITLALSMASFTHSSVAASYLGFGNGGGGQKDNNPKNDKANEWWTTKVGNTADEASEFLKETKTTIKEFRETELPAFKDKADNIELKIDLELQKIDQHAKLLVPKFEEAANEVIKTSQMLTRLMQVASILAILLILRDFMLPFTSLVAPSIAQLLLGLFRKEYRYDMDISLHNDETPSPEILVH